MILGFSETCDLRNLLLHLQMLYFSVGYYTSQQDVSTWRAGTQSLTTTSSIHKIQEMFNKYWLSKFHLAKIGQKPPIRASGNKSGSFFQGIFQARVLKWVTISFSRGSSQPMYHHSRNPLFSSFPFLCFAKDLSPLIEQEIQEHN